MLPKIEKQIRPNTLKMPRKYKLKEERDGGDYLQRVFRSARKRERSERRSDERESFGLSAKWRNDARKKKKRSRLGWVLPFKTASFHLSETASLSHTNDWMLASNGRHVVWSREKTTGRLFHTDDSTHTESQTTCRFFLIRTTSRPIHTNDTSFDHLHERPHA